MAPEIGTITLILALLVAVVQFILPMIGAETRYAPWMKLAVIAGRTQFVLVATAFSCLAYSFINNDIRSNNPKIVPNPNQD